MSEDKTIEVQIDEAFAIVPLWIARHPELSDRAVRLYATLAGYADNGTGRCWPSRARLAADLRCSTDSVDRAARELQLAGAVTVQKRIDDAGNQLPNLWTLHRLGGGRTDAARGGRSPAAGGAAPVRHRTRSKELDTHADACGGGEAEAEASAPAPRRKDRLTPYRDALLQAFGVDPATIPGKRGWGPWNAAAKDLHDAGVDPGQVAPMLKRLRERDAWRERITPIVLVQEWAGLLAGDAPADIAHVDDPARAVARLRTILEPDDLPEDAEVRLRAHGFTPTEIQAAIATVFEEVA